MPDVAIPSNDAEMLRFLQYFLKLTGLPRPFGARNDVVSVTPLNNHLQPRLWQKALAKRRGLWC